MKRILKKILSEKNYGELHYIKIKLIFHFNKLLSSSSILLRFSLIFNNYYVREQKAVLKGAVEYSRKQFYTQNNTQLLRREIHRLEKGLLMRPRREAFALSYIYQVILLLKNTHKSNKDNFNKWCHDVLEQYFSVTKSTDKRYYRAKNEFSDLKKELSCSDDAEKYQNLFRPYKKAINNLQLNSSEFLKLLKNRKSVRWFVDMPIPKDMVEKAVKAASFSPSSCNRQPFKYYITTNSMRARSLAKYSGGTAGWSENIPNIAILVGNLNNFNNTSSRHSIYIDASLSVMPFILFLETNNIASCIINWADKLVAEKRIKQELGLSETEKVILSIAFGYPDQEGFVAYSERKQVDELLTYVK